MSEAKKPPCGFLNILKPPGMTSSQVVGYVRWLLNGAKVGHGGTLDPEASGGSAGAICAACATTCRRRKRST